MKDNSLPPLLDMQQNAESAAGMLKLLANEKRLIILCQLVQEERPVGKLVELTGLSQSALSQHLAKLRHHGIVSCEKRGQSVYYRVCSQEVAAVLSVLHLMYCKR